MDRNLALEMVRVTETAALSSARMMGRGDRKAADQAAVDAMRRAFDSVEIKGTVVIGKAERDEAPMLYIGERVGSGWQHPDHHAPRGRHCRRSTGRYQPVRDWTAGFHRGHCGGGRWSVLNAPDTYMHKLVVGPWARGASTSTKVKLELVCGSRSEALFGIGSDGRDLGDATGCNELAEVRHARHRFA